MATQKKSKAKSVTKNEIKIEQEISDCEIRLFGSDGYVIQKCGNSVKIAKVSAVRVGFNVGDTIELKVLESMVLPQDLLNRAVESFISTCNIDDDAIPF